MSQGVLTDQIQKEIDKLSDSILKAQGEINSLKEPDPDKGPILDKFLQEYEQARGRALFYRYASSGRGSGPFSELMDGSVKYDLISGIVLIFWGMLTPFRFGPH